MDTIDPALKGVLEAFLDAVAVEVPVKAAYLYGSRARGDAAQDSDVDVVVVSDAFRGMRRADTIALLLLKTRGLRVDLQPVGLAPEDLDNGDEMTRAILSEGVLIRGA